MFHFWEFIIVRDCQEECEGGAFVRLPYSISAMFPLQYAQQETQQTSFIVLYNSLVFLLLLWPPPTNTFVFLGRGWTRCFRPFDGTGLLFRGSFYFFGESEINLDLLGTLVSWSSFRFSHWMGCVSWNVQLLNMCVECKCSSPLTCRAQETEVPLFDASLYPYSQSVILISLCRTKVTEEMKGFKRNPTGVFIRPVLAAADL